MTSRTTSRAARLDQVCADAVGVARGAITEVDPADVGEHLEAIAEGDWNILLTSYLSPESRMLIRRNVVKRLDTLA